MDQTHQHELAETVGTDIGRVALLEEIVAKVEGSGAADADDDLDLWWGLVESDRLASGLTLATIHTLSTPCAEDDLAGAWLERSDEAGDELTRLTPEGRKAVKRINAAEEVA